MKKSKSLSKTLRRSLDQKLKPYLQARKNPRPLSGWIQTVRDALGMTTAQLAERMGIQQSGVMALQKRELAKTITLESLEKAAKALNCTLVYALVPNESLDKTLEDQCRLYAKSVLGKTQHSMSLEDQSVLKPESDLHLEELAQEFKRKLDSKIWKVK